MIRSIFPLSNLESKTKYSPSLVKAEFALSAKHIGFMPTNSKAEPIYARVAYYATALSDLSPKRSFSNLSYLNFPQS